MQFFKKYFGDLDKKSTDMTARERRDTFVGIGLIGVLLLAVLWLGAWGLDGWVDSEKGRMLLNEFYGNLKFLIGGFVVWFGLMYSVGSWCVAREERQGEK